MEDLNNGDSVAGHHHEQPHVTGHLYKYIIRVFDKSLKMIKFIIIKFIKYWTLVYYSQKIICQYQSRPVNG